MKKKYIYTYIALLAITVLTALLANFSPETSKIIGFSIMGLAAIKFLLVVFQFMELKEAHVFWRFSITMVCLLIVLVVGVFGSM